MVCKDICGPSISIKLVRLDGKSKEVKTINLTDRGNEFSFSKVLPGKYRVEVMDKGLDSFLLSTKKLFFFFWFMSLFHYFIFSSMIMLLVCAYFHVFLTIKLLVLVVKVWHAGPFCPYFSFCC